MEMASPIRIAGEDLREELEIILSDYFGEKREILGLRRRRSSYSSSYTIENLEVELDKAKPLRLILKDLSPTSLLSEARDVRPQFLYSPQREIEIYRSLLNSQEFGTPVYYGALEQTESQRYWLFLERVEGPLLWQVGRLEHWEGAAAWLGRFHAHFAMPCKQGHDRLPSVLLSYDAAHFLRWMERAERFLARRPSSANQALKVGFQNLVKRYDRVVDSLLAIPQTLIHGEFYPSNVILRTDESAKTICPIDWEVAAIGPGLIDLAALVSGAWRQEERQRLVKAYCQAARAVSTDSISLKDTLRMVDYCQLHLAVQWLGWASDWSPPKNHEQNWLQEALRLGKRLDLI